MELHFYVFLNKLIDRGKKHRIIPQNQAEREWKARKDIEGRNMVKARQVRQVRQVTEAAVDSDHE